MKYNYPDYKLKSEFIPGTFSENDWELGEIACTERLYYVFPDDTEFAFYKFVKRTMTGRKKTRWEAWYNGKFSNNYFTSSFDDATKWMERYMEFNGFGNNRNKYRVKEER